MYLPRQEIIDVPWPLQVGVARGEHWHPVGVFSKAPVVARLQVGAASNATYDPARPVIVRGRGLLLSSCCVCSIAASLCESPVEVVSAFVYGSLNSDRAKPTSESDPAPASRLMMNLIKKQLLAFVCHRNRKR